VWSEQVFRSAIRRVVATSPQVRPVLESGAPLESMGGEGDPPKLIDAQGVEDATFCVRSVGTPETGFGAFLDGAQRSFVVAWEGSAPVVGARVAAAVRLRVDRRLTRWREPLVRWRIYADFSRVSRDPWLAAFPPEELADLSASADERAAGTPFHPLEALERARSEVSADRERLERSLAREWCEREDAPLYVDGGIGGEDAIAHSPLAVGVVKSHRTLYVSGAALETVLALEAGERSSVLRLAPRGRASILSWYLRLRNPAGRGALWGLVRIECADGADVTERADLLSRWVLAEGAPLALPDPRWDTLVYGIRGCEEYLRAIG
jgi:hypothetical protein